MWLWLVETQVKTFEVARGPSATSSTRLATIPHLSDDSGAIVFDASTRACQGIQESFEMSFPSADMEVEIISPHPAASKPPEELSPIWLLSSALVH
jgi:hypothetical protein